MKQQATVGLPPSSDMSAYMRAYRELVALQMHVPQRKGRRRKRVGAAPRTERLPEIEQQAGHCPFCGLETERTDCCVMCVLEIGAGRM